MVTEKGIEVIFVTLDDLVEDIDEICRLARKFKDGEVVMCLGSGNEEETNNLKTMTEETKTAQPSEDVAVNAVHAGQKGFSMVEMMIAVTLISIVLLAIGTLSSICASGIALVQRKRASENYAVELSSKLKADQKIMMPEGGAFAVDAATGDPQRATDGAVALNCSALYCDKIISVPSGIEGASATEKIISWDAQLPGDATVKFVRAWTLSDEDAQRNWRRITVAVFPPDSQIPATFSVTGGVIK